MIINIPRIADRRNVITEGCWNGNDTLWRTILDFNSILFYADKKGELKNKRQRNYLTVIGGIMGGEGEEPLSAAPKKCGVLIGGYDPVAVDTVATTVMGFDVEKINQIQNVDKNEFPIGTSDINQIKIIPKEASRLRFDFKPPESWKDVLTKK